MDVKKPNNPTAFPVHPNCETDYDAGMTLRDYFAAKAMQSILSNQTMFNQLITAISNNDKPNGIEDYVASLSYIYSDAMLKQREL